MISQNAPRKNLQDLRIPKNKGFWVDGTNYSDCIRQLKEYGSQHPDKWIYFHDCGVGPGHPIPVSRHLLEVSIFDAEPAADMLFYQCFQKGSEGRREIDSMSADEQGELQKKQMTFFAMLGSSMCKRKD